MPDEEALFEEGQLMDFAESLTVGDTLMLSHFHILEQPDLYQRLKREFLTVWSDFDNPPSLEVLETLPLPTATIKESLRVALGSYSSLIRVAPDGDATIANYMIPGGTAVGMVSFFLHNSEDIFEKPELFNPNRWLGSNAKV